MFTRNLTEKEIKIIHKIVDLIKEKHSNTDAHDYSHVLEVTRYSIEIAKKIKEKVDPFVTICGALLHDIGRVDEESGALHGFKGGVIAEAFLESAEIAKNLIEQIKIVVIRHTPTSLMPPKTTEGRVVFDADRIECLGRLGILRGVMGKKGSMEQIIERVIDKRSKGYGIMYFDESREIAKDLYKDTMDFLTGLKKDLEKRCTEIQGINLPVEDMPGKK